MDYCYSSSSNVALSIVNGIVALASGEWTIKALGQWRYRAGWVDKKEGNEEKVAGSILRANKN